jgi:hypothetical protein
VRAPHPVEVMRRLDEMPEVEKTSVFGTSVHAVLRSNGSLPKAIADRLATSGVDVKSAVVEPSLEDVFLDVVERMGRS